MQNIIAFTFVFLSAWSFAQPNWQAEHEKYLKKIKNQNLPQRYEELLANPEDGIEYLYKRIDIGLTLGKVSDIIAITPKYYDHPEYDIFQESGLSKNYIFDVFYLPASEVQRIYKMHQMLLDSLGWHEKAREDLIHSMLELSYLAGDFSNCQYYVQEQLKVTTDPKEIERLKDSYGDLYFEMDKLNEAGTYFKKLYESEKSRAYLDGYLSYLVKSQDSLALLDFEEEIVEHRLYFRYHQLAQVYSDKNDLENAEKYYSWFRDSVHQTKYSPYMFEYEPDDAHGHVFDAYLMFDVAQFYKDKDSEYACSMYPKLLKISELEWEYEFGKQFLGQRIIAAHGTPIEKKFTERYLKLDSMLEELLANLKEEMNACPEVDED